MKRPWYILVISLISIMLIISACGSVSSGGSSGTVMGYRPDWWLYQSHAEDYIYSYGQALNSTEAKSLAAAHANAQDEASQYVEGQLRQLVSKFAQEAGIVDPTAFGLTDKLIHAIAGARFNGSFKGKTETRAIMDKGKARYKSWVQLVIPKEQINNNLINNINYDEALSALFQNSSSFKMMEQSLTKP